MELLKLTIVSAVFMSFSGITIADDKVKIGEPMQLGDSAMTCQKLIEESAKMQTVIGGAPKGSMLDSEVTQALAAEGAARSGLVGGKVGSALKLFGGKSKKKKAAKKAKASSRWFYIVGLYQGRQCGMTKPEIVNETSQTDPTGKSTEETKQKDSLDKF